ncbi:hypothetical protein GCM10027167_00360 [Nocardia heshunensis]
MVLSTNSLPSTTTVTCFFAMMATPAPTMSVTSIAAIAPYNIGERDEFSFAIACIGNPGMVTVR